MESAGHFGFEGLLGFLPGFFPGFFPLLGFFLARPPSTSQSSTSPMLAVAESMPCSLFLYSHLFPSSISSLSCPKPVLMNPLTKLLARFCLALSTAPPPKAGLTLSRWVLYTSSGVLASMMSSSRARLRKWLFRWLFDMISVRSS